MLKNILLLIALTFVTHSFGQREIRDSSLILNNGTLRDVTISASLGLPGMPKLRYNVTKSAWEFTHDDTTWQTFTGLEYVDGELALKAPLESPALTGDPTAPTALPGDNDTSLSTTEFVTDAVATLETAHDLRLDAEEGISLDHEVRIGDLETDTTLADHISATEAHGATGSVVGTTNTQTLSNKTIDADSNVISNIEVADLKSGVLDADISVTEATHTTIPSALAVKTYADAGDSANSTAMANHLSDITDAHDASAISNVASGNLTATDVQSALNEHQGDIDSLDGRVSTVESTAIANDATALHKTGDESASGVKTFTGKLVTSSTANGSLPCPVMTEAQRNAIASPVAGDCVFNSTTNSLNVYNGTLWKAAGGGLSPWETAFSYAVGDIVIESDKIYQAVEAHTSTVFSTDYLVDAKWKIISEGLISAKGQSDLSYSTISRLEAPNKQMTLVSGGNALIETGNGNVLPNPGFEGAFIGWVSYKDAAAATPENGIGGTAVSAINFTASSPLRGAKSGLFIKPTTVNSLGEGFSTDFTIDPADKTKIIDISFDYESSPNYADGDIRIYIFDVSNARVIELVNRDLMANANGTYRGFFQASPDSVNYRLIGHVATASMLDYTVKLDNVKVAPQAPKVTGAIKTDWMPYTPTVSHASGTMTNYSLSNTFWKRDGDSILLKGKIIFTGSVGTFTDIKISLPSGVTRNTTVSPNFSNLGEVRFWDAGTGDFGGTVYSDNASNIALLPNGISTHTGTVPVRGVSLTQAFPFTFVSGDSITWQTDPIAVQGWSSNMVLSEDAGNREIVFYINKSNLPYAVGTPLAFGSGSATFIDTANGYNPTTSQYTIPESGIYDLGGQLNFMHSATSGQYMNLGFYVNGINTRYFTARAVTGEASKSTPLNYTLRLNKGDVVDIRIQAGNFTSPTIQGDPSYFSIAKRSSPQTIAASETVAVSATQTSGQNLPNTTLTTVIWNSKTEDTHNALNLSNGKFITPISGRYAISLVLLSSNTSWIPTSEFTGQIMINGVAFLSFPNFARGTVTTFMNTGGSATVYLKKGDEVTMHLFQSSGATIQISNAAVHNRLSITRVGN